MVAAEGAGGERRQLGPYQLIRRLAIGGMAEIFLARRRAIQGFEKTVVLKRILPEHATNPMFVRLFLAEARIAAVLQHPNVVPVYDIGEDDGTYFFTMEFIAGIDLRRFVELVRSKPVALPLEHVLHIAIGMAAGLHYAHGATTPDGRPLGIVHRDVSPSNVLVTFEGGVKVVDFGVAKAANVTTVVGALKGKIPYMSPEQARSESLDARSDVFSIGTILWELTTGRRLFRGNSEIEMLKHVAFGEVPPPSSVRPDYPPVLERIVMKALQRDRDRRYDTALQLRIELEDFAREAGLPVSAARLRQFIEHACAEEIERVAALGADGVAPHVRAPFGHADSEAISLSPDDRTEIATAPHSRKVAPWIALGLGAVVLLATGAWVVREQSSNGEGAVAQSEAAATAEDAAPSDLAATPIDDAAPREVSAPKIDDAVPKEVAAPPSVRVEAEPSTDLTDAVQNDADAAIASSRDPIAKRRRKKDKRRDRPAAPAKKAEPWNPKAAPPPGL